jgi:hypothetical protein
VAEEAGITFDRKAFDPRIAGFGHSRRGRLKKCLYLLLRFVFDTPVQ